MRISEAFELHRKLEITARGLSTKTRETYENTEKLTIGYFGDIEVSLIDQPAVVGFYEHLLGWQRPDTARLNIMSFRAVIKLLNRKKYEVMDWEDIKIPKRQKRMIYYLTKPEVDAFIEVVSQKRRGYSELNRLRNIAIAECLFSSGVRVSELCRLNKNQVKDRQFIVVGKSKEPRPCYISRQADAALRAYLERREDKSPALFVNNQNGERTKPGNVRRIFTNACRRSDFEGVHPHTMRHSFATFMLDKGVELIYIGDMMGHQSLDTTRIYTHYANSKLRQIHESAMG